MEIRITNLRLRTLVGIEPWEREKRQDVVINVWLRFDGRAAAQSDEIADTVDYKRLTKAIIAHVEGGQFGLVERLAQELLDLAMTDERVQWARVQVDKPHALRFADSVGVTAETERPAP